MGKSLRLVLADQLSTSISSLADINKNDDKVLMAEVREEATYVKHHKKKIVFLFSAMRHFAEALRHKGIGVEYIDYQHDDNQASLVEQVAFTLAKDNFDKVVVTMPGEFRVYQDMLSWQDKFGIPVDIRPDNRFVADQDFFAQWASGRKQLRMEYFYREMRKQTGLLMEADKPVGGKWNYDAENRSPLAGDKHVPQPTKFEIDETTQSVIELVGSEFGDHFGDIMPFHYAVTREQALQVLDDFITNRLADFGKYQDAMAQGQPWLFHSHISFYLNCGLLMPAEVMDAAEAAYKKGKVPLNSVEGFIRQILGWREYIRGFYWYFMPDLAGANFLRATRALPSFYWTAQTNMNCLRQCITETRENAYAHHIQRLMVLGNFALLAGLSPEEVNEWYLIVYADAYEWVEMPNVSGMILFADGGNLASKPYAASGSYINKMSDYCKQCGYKVAQKTGDTACPFNYLYWDFIDRNSALLADNPRMNMIMNTYSKMSADKLQDVKASAHTFFNRLDNAQEV